MKFTENELNDIAEQAEEIISRADEHDNLSNGATTNNDNDENKTNNELDETNNLKATIKQQEEMIDKLAGQLDRLIKNTNVVIRNEQNSEGDGNEVKQNNQDSVIDFADMDFTI